MVLSQTKCRQKNNQQRLCWSTLFLCFYLLAFHLPAQAMTASIVIDSASGEVMSEENANHLWYPASLSKVMTLYLTFQALQENTISLEDAIVITQGAAKQAKVKLGLKQGEQITVEQAILAVTTQSANDAAFLLAEYLAGTEVMFAKKMTQQARRLGMSNTSFKNASGLPNRHQVTTAWDMVLLAEAVRRDFPDYYHYFSQPYFDYKKQYQNSNSLLRLYSGMDGLKTGFTCASAYNIMSSVQRGGTRLTAVVLGAKDNQQRTRQMITLLDDAFKQADQATGKNISQLQENSSQQPVVQLSTDQCQQSKIVQEVKRTEIVNATLILGAFQTEEEAETLLKKISPTVKQLTEGGYSLVKHYEMNGMLLWHVIWTDLEQNQAEKVCKALWEIDEYCQTVPAIIFSKEYIL